MAENNGNTLYSPQSPWHLPARELPYFSTFPHIQKWISQHLAYYESGFFTCILNTFKLGYTHKCLAASCLVHTFI